MLAKESEGSVLVGFHTGHAVMLNAPAEEIELLELEFGGS